jgi:hypothetical protein
MKSMAASVRLSLAGGVAFACLGVGPIALVGFTPTRAFAQETAESCAAAGLNFIPASHTNSRPMCAGQTAPVVDPHNCASVQAAIAWDDRQTAANSTNVAMQQSFTESKAALQRLLPICGGSGGGSSGIPAGGFGSGYAPITGARGTAQRSNQITNNLVTSDNMALGILAEQAADEEAAREQEQQAADEQAQEDQAIRDAQEAQQRAQAAADDTNRRAGLADPFAGQQQPTSPDNPFGPVAGAGDGAPVQVATADPDGNPFDVPAGPAAGAAGQPVQVTTADPDGNPFAAPAGPAAPTPAPPIASDPPNRKLGEPSQADSLAPIAYSACKAMAPRSDIITLPGGTEYCVVEVDTPELTNEWHHLIDDPLRSAPHAPSPNMSVKG